MTKANPNLIAVGDNCLDAYLNKGFLAVGGNALNVAVQWRRHGLNARYFGALGQDTEADIMLEAIAEAGLDRSDVEIRPGSSAVTLLADDAGERRFLLESLGVGENYVPSAERYEALRQADWVHLGTNSSEQLVRRLVADGMPFSIDVSTRHFELSLEGVPLVFASGPDDPAEAVEPLIARFRAAGARRQGDRGEFGAGRRRRYLRRRGQLHRDLHHVAIPRRPTGQSRSRTRRRKGVGNLHPSRRLPAAHPGDPAMVARQI